LLDRLRNILADIGSIGLPIWWWDLGIHQNDIFLQMIITVVTMIFLHHCGDIVRGVVDPCSICQGIFSLTIPRIDSVYGLVGFNINEIP
jgi:hypothetical protein